MKAAGLPLLCAGLLAGCLAPVSRIPGIPGNEGALSAELTMPGANLIELDGYPENQAWHSFSLANRGSTTAGNILLWGLGRSSIIHPDNDAIPSVRILPFALLPEEQFICTSTGESGEPGSGLVGSLFWEIPDNLNGFKACMTRRNRVKLNEPSGLTWSNLQREGLVEFSFNAPFPHRSAHVSWSAQTTIQSAVSANVTLDVTKHIRAWISPDGNSWVRVRPPHGGVSWINPMDLTGLVRNQHQFILRLSVNHPEGEIISGTRRKRPDNITLTRMRVEREIAAPGGIRPLKMGSDSIPVWFETAQGTPSLLQFRMWNDKLSPDG